MIRSRPFFFSPDEHCEECYLQGSVEDHSLHFSTPSATLEVHGVISIGEPYTSMALLVYTVLLL
jgi:hypothetical protein